MKKKLLFVLIIFANLIMLTKLYSLSILNENTDETFSSIQTAVNDSNTQDGDTLTILTAWYTTNYPYPNQKHSSNIHTEKGITVSKDLTIQGQGADITIIQAHANENSATDRVFNIYSGKTVTLKNMTIKHGKSDDGSIGLHGENAGGIYNSGTLYLINIHLCNNRTGNGGDGYPDGGIGLIGGYGGGIYNAGTLTLTNSTISNNITGSGGDGGSASVGSSNGGDGGLGGKGSGIYNIGILTLINSTISNNENGPGGNGGEGGVDSGNGGDGGLGGSGSGIYNNGILILDSSTIANNRTGDGGAFGSGFTPGLPGSPGCAGGIGLFGDTLSIKNTIIANNYEGSFGSTCDDYYYNAGILTDNGYNLVEITNAAAGANGFTNGTNYNIVGEQADLGLDSTLTYTGGFTQTLAVISGVLTQSANYGSTTETTDQRGYYRKTGTLYNGDTPTLVTAGITRGAYQYYGVVARSNTDPNWTSSSNNYYTNIQGAANHVSVGSTIILAGTAIFESGITINKNITISGEGNSNTFVQSSQSAGSASGVIFEMVNYLTVTLSDMTIRYGLRGIYNSRCTLFLDNITISENTSSSGGGIYNHEGTMTITNCIITGNSITADYGKGGGIYSLGIYSSLSLSNVTITNNYSNEPRSYGGGIYCSKSLSIDGGTVSNNSVGTSGGGIYSTGTLSLTDITISNNTGGVFSGGGIYHSGSNLSLTDVTISGNTAGTIGGGGIYCSGSNMNLNNVTISENTISSGDMYFNGGGGIRCSSVNSLSLSNVTISGNSGGYLGGGIYFGGGNLPTTMQSSNATVTSNSAENGGGIAFYDITYGTLENITISDNSAHSGGGICFLSTSLSSSIPILTNITIINNSASASGGGISFLSGSSPILTDVSVINNSCSSRGGGIYCYDNSSPTLDNLIIKDNSGSGIYCKEYSSPILKNVSITGNSSNNSGGGIYCNGSSIPSFDINNRSNIYLNHAVRSGNDIYSSQLITVIVDTFTVLNPTNYHASSIENFTFDILNSKVGDQANSDLYVNSAGSNANSGLTPEDPLLSISMALIKIIADSITPHIIHIANGTYSPAQTDETFPLNCRSYVSLHGENEPNVILDGEELSDILSCWWDSNFSIENMTIQNGNTGIYLFLSNPNLTNVTISGNSAAAGGGICCYYSSPSLDNVLITGNSANNSGGGIHCHDSSPSLDNVLITGNSANNSGGGIYCYDFSPNLENVTISGNSAAAGGGIYYDTSNPIMVDVLISNNSSSYGGGLYLYSNSSTSFDNVTIKGNFAHKGGGIYCSCNSSILENLTIVGNSAIYYGGGVYCNYNSSPSLINTIVSDNTGDFGIYVASGNPTITYSDFWDNESGNFYGVNDSIGVNVTTNANGDACDSFYNIQMDPLYVDPNSNYNLLENSPCINAGDPSSPLDPDGTIADMGAYYYHQQQTPAYTNIKVFLEGPYNAVGDTMVCSLTLPTTSPYDIEDIGSLPTVTGHSLVDWIQVKLRTTATGSTVDSCNAFLLEDGSVVDVDGNSSLPFYNTAGNEYYIVIHHRNHIDIMSAVKYSFGSSPLDNKSGNDNYTKKYNRNRLTKNNVAKHTFKESQRESTNIDLTIPGSIYGDGYQELETGIIGMYSGDINNDGEVTTSDYTSWYNAYIIGSSGYQITDLNLDGEVTTSDYTKWYNNFIVGASSSIPGQTRESSGKSKKIILKKIEENTKTNVRRKHEKQVKN